MAINLAARRGAKNQKRKAVVAQKRKAEIEANTTAGRVRLALAHPIQHCLMSEELFETGTGMLAVVRGPTPSGGTVVAFLLDTFGMGVKDTYMRSISGSEFTDLIEKLSSASPLARVDPGYARKLLHDLVAWARNLGIAPHRDYAKLEPIFGTVSAASSDVEFQFGHEGKPLFIGDISQFMERMPGDFGAIAD